MAIRGLVTFERTVKYATIMKILVVDDSPGMRDLIKRLVSDVKPGNHEFIEASNGLEAEKSSDRAT